MTLDSNLANDERRRNLRFLLNTELRYQVCVRKNRAPIRGTGQVHNIGSKGLAFRADGPLTAGWRLSVSMAWAAKLDDCMLRLVFEGVILRASDDLVVVTIERADFRTAGTTTGTAREEIAIIMKYIESTAGHPVHGSRDGE